MSQIAGLQDFRAQGTPADIGTFLMPVSVLVFKHTFGGTTYVCAVRSGERGWVLVSYLPYTVANWPTVANAAITAANGGDIFIVAGTYQGSAQIAVNVAGTTLKGAGYGTLLQANANTFPVLYITVDNCTVENLRIQGSGAVNVLGRGVYSLGADGVTIRACSIQNTPGDSIYMTKAGGTNYNLVCGCVFTGWLGTYAINVEGKFNCFVDNKLYAPGSATAGGIALSWTGSDNNVVADNIMRNIRAYNIYVHAPDNVIVGNNISSYDYDVGTGIYFDTPAANVAVSCISGNKICHLTNGIYLTGANDITISGNAFNRCVGDTIVVLDSLDIRIDGNSIWETLSPGSGIKLTGTTIRAGVTNNNIKRSYRHGIWLDTNVSDCVISGNVIQEADYNNTGTYDGIFLGGNNDDNLIVGNKLLNGDRYGINISAATCERNTVFLNRFSGNTAGPINDAGTNTCLPTLILPFVDGTIFLSADGVAWGWEIDDATEYAITLGHLPAEVQRIVRINVRAVSLVAEADAMRLKINGYGGAPDEAFTQETIAVANKASATTNFAVNDYVVWTLTSTDDADIGDLLGGDSVMFKVLYEVAGNGDCATDAVFLCVEIQYV